MSAHELPSGLWARPNKRGGVVYYACYRLANGELFRKKLSSIKETAIEIFTELKAREDKARFCMRPNDYSWATLKDEFLKWIRKPKIKNRHDENAERLYKEYKTNIERFERFFNPTICSDVTIEIAIKYQVFRSTTPRDPHPGKRSKKNGLAPVSARTVNMELGTIINMFNRGVDWGRLGSNPLEKLKRLPEPKREKRVTPQDENEQADSLRKAINCLPFASLTAPISLEPEMTILAPLDTGPTENDKEQPLEENTESIKIQFTTDYSIFKHHPENRPVRMEGRNAMKKSLREHGFIKERPILCVLDPTDGLLMVCDGQHTLEACKELGMGVWYSVRDKSINIPLFNSSQKDWAISDYILNHCDNGKQEYKEAVDFARVNELTFTIAFAILEGKQTIDREAVKMGEYTITARGFAAKVVAVYRPMCMLLPALKATNFAKACVKACLVETFEPERMVRKASKNRDMLDRHSTVDKYIDMLDSIYDFNRAAKEDLFCLREQIRRYEAENPTDEEEE